MTVNSSDGLKEKCFHNTLCFHSGGYYIQCKGCGAYWVAIKGAHTSDQELDHARGGDGLFAQDERVNPEH